MHLHFDQNEAHQEKSNAALYSILAALVLTGLKLGVGLAANSLGMLSEALHSGLDFMAAGMTFFAVRYASIPADNDHPYGHGKMENLSALAEAVLLLVTCGWIIYEAVERIFFNPVTVSPTIWAVAVMAVSIIIDFFRARHLKRIAKKHNSQALEADALHFSTDMLSSGVVLLGIGALYLSQLFPEGSLTRQALSYADPVAALGVAAIVLFISFSLGKRAVNVLLDAGDIKLQSKIGKALKALPGLGELQDLRLRQSGPDIFVDVVVGADSSLVLDETQQLRQEVEAAVQSVVPKAIVSIEIVPDEIGFRDRNNRLRGLAAAYGLTPHSIEFLELDSGGWNRLLLELHVELPDDMPLKEAHDKVAAFEERLREHVPGIIVFTHIEPKIAGDVLTPTVRLDERSIQAEVNDLLKGEPMLTDCHNFLFRSVKDGLYAGFHCRMAPETTVREAHEAASRVEQALHKRIPALKKVIVHVEPVK